jgi:hypothetical protein
MELVVVEGNAAGIHTRNPIESHRMDMEGYMDQKKRRVD